MTCLRCHPPKDREIGSLKMCLQYFQSVNQLRLSLFRVKDLCVENQKCFIEVSASSGYKKIKCSSKTVQGSCFTASFNENLYIMLQKELDVYDLRIKLVVDREKRCLTCCRKSATIGQAVINLDCLNLDLDTSLEIRLKPKGRQSKISSRDDIKMYRDETIDDHLRRTQSVKLASQLYSRNRRSPVVIHSLSVFKETFTECEVNDDGNINTHVALLNSRYLI